MAEKSGFFNSNSGDRMYDSSDFAAYFATLIGNGVFPQSSSVLQVSASSGMGITVKVGKAWINGYYYNNTTDGLSLTIPAASTANPRIDAVVLRFSLSTRSINAVIKQGSVSASPVAPAMQRDNSVWELCLAQIRVNKSVSSIAQSNITDTRFNTSLCGVVAGLVTTIDTSAFNEQLQAWLNGTQAAQLEQSIDDFEVIVNQLASAVASKSGGYGICSSVGASSQKAVSIPGFNLAAGGTISVKFENTNTANVPSLNVNGTGAKRILYPGIPYSADTDQSAIIQGGFTYTFIYDGSYWQMQNAAPSAYTESDIQGTGVSRGNTAFGKDAGSLAATGSGTNAAYNTAVGLGAAKNNYGSYNAAVGKRSLGGGINTSIGNGSYNAVLGAAAAQALTTGSYNTGAGYSGLYSLTTGQYNTGVGHNALFANMSGTKNTAIGANSAYYLSGSYNTAVGCNALERTSSAASGNYNTAVGYLAGSKNWNSTQAGATATALARTTCLGAYAYASGDNQVQLGGYGDSVYGASAYNSRSDKRDKTDIQNLTYDALEFINALTPCNFRYDKREAYFHDEIISLEEWRDSGLTIEEQQSYVEEVDEKRSKAEGCEVFRYRRTVQDKRDGNKKGKRLHNGFIAQEVAAVAENLGFDFAGWQDHAYNGGGDVQTLAYEEFIAPIVKAIQLLTEQNRQLKSKIEILEGGKQ